MGRTMYIQLAQDTDASTAILREEVIKRRHQLEEVVFHKVSLQFWLVHLAETDAVSPSSHKSLGPAGGLRRREDRL